MKVNVLLEGTIGTGKTHSLRTLVEDCNQELFVLAVEPGISSILGDLPCSQGCHWAYIPPGSISWEMAAKNAEKMNSYSIEQLIKMPGINKQEYQQLLDVYSLLSNFKCDRCEEEFGPVDDWDDSRTIAVDGLTGISTMCVQLVVGAKPLKSLPEWLGAQEMVKVLIDKLAYDTKCNFVLIAHVDRERDEVSGRNVLTVSTLGKALAPKLLKPFDEIVFARRVPDTASNVKFFWSTTETEVEQKARILPWGDELEPNFSQIFNRMREMQEKGSAA